MTENKHLQLQEESAGTNDLSIGKGITIAFFPIEIQKLNLEIQFHPKLLEYISRYNYETQFEEVMAEVAAYCGIIMDGYYERPEQVKLAGICADMMEAERLKYPGQEAFIVRSTSAVDRLI